MGNSHQRFAEILLVEDDPSDAELTLRALKQGGFDHQVEHVKDGEEALDYVACAGVFARRHPPVMPKMILLDLALGKISGLQVLRQLKTDPRTRGIPIVVLTSSRLAIEAAESYEFGVNSYVLKPTDGHEFAKTVEAIGHYWLRVNEAPPVNRTNAAQNLKLKL